jgi:hypothetical protein
MELINLLKEEIKKLASEENINVNKLNEYTRIYERLKAFDVTTVQQINTDHELYRFEPQMVRPMVGHAPRMGTVPIGNELGGIFDILREVANMTNKPKSRNEIDEFIYWTKFLKDLKKDIKDCPMTDRLSEIWDREINNLIYKLRRRVFTIMTRKLDESIKKEILENERETKKEMETNLDKDLNIEEQEKQGPSFSIRRSPFDTSDASRFYHENNSSEGAQI